MGQQSLRTSPTKRAVNSKLGNAGKEPLQEQSSPYKSHSVADALAAVHYTPEQRVGQRRSFGNGSSGKPGQGAPIISN